jgi:hypothetical protein
LQSAYLCKFNFLKLCLSHVSLALDFVIEIEGRASLDRKSDKFSFGIDFGIGLTRKTLQAINITEPTAGNFLLGEKQNTVIPQINSINFVMGYTYKFNKTDRLMKIRPL